ncbi:MAG TPA: hypothetical protein VH231_14075 [Solirubrobacteraceae bacterium]|nr:hypothetical protein [Solirubrobacteraceae bacterium]
MNPFVYTGPVSADHVIDRDEQAELLVELADAGQAARLSAPRRYGKTSLLYRVRRDVERLGFSVVYVDFSRAVSIEDVAVTIEEAYRRSLQGKVRQAAVALIRYVKPKARAGAAGVGVEVGPELDSEKVRLLGSLLDLPLRIHERTGTRTLVIFDEFQELLSAGDDLDRLFRSRIQHHGKAASYVFAGSHPEMMDGLFARKARPFFDQARPVYLEPLSDPDLGDYIAGQFEATGRQVGEAIEPLLDLVEGHPQRGMLLAHHLWEQTDPGQTSDLEAWHRARTAAESEAADALQATWDAMSIAARRVVAALASTMDGLLSNRTLHRFELAKTTAAEVRDRLVGTGDLQRVGEQVTIVDPLLAEWARHRIPGESDE